MPERSRYRSDDLPFYTCEAEVSQLAALTGRLGVTWGRALFYAKGGVAAGEVTATKTPITPSPTAFGVPVVPVILANGVSTSNWQVGWTAALGMEFALTDRWSAKAEYLHYELGRDTVHYIRWRSGHARRDSWRYRSHRCQSASPSGSERDAAQVAK